MATTNFIPTIWTENLYQQLNNKYVAVKNCNREWEGEIKQAGDRVKILGLNNINVFDYRKGTNMNAPLALSDSVRELVIDQAKAFNFIIDDVDRAQSMPRLMDLALNNAANALAAKVDEYIFSLSEQVDSSKRFLLPEADSSNIIDFISEGILHLVTAGVTDDIILEVSPIVAALILKAKIEMSTDNTAALENGYIGSIAGCKVFVSPNIATSVSDNGDTYLCVLRSKRSVAFAEQLSEVEAYRPELRFADAVKGLMLFGAKIVYPNEYYVLEVEVVTI